MTLTDAAHKHAPRDNALPALAVLNFALIGVLVIYFPQLADNGRGPTGLSFDDSLGFALAGVLLILKVTIEVSSLRAGAQGGLLTPSLTHGALLGVVLGSVWNGIWPGTPLGAFAVIGAAAFLGPAMQMPLTALVLMIEFTRFNHDFLILTALAMAGASLAYRALARSRIERPSTAPEQTLRRLTD